MTNVQLLAHGSSYCIVCVGWKSCWQDRCVHIILVKWNRNAISLLAYWNKHTKYTRIQPVVWWFQHSVLLGLGPPAAGQPSGPPPSENPSPVVSLPLASHCPGGSSAGPAHPPPWSLERLQYLPQSVWGHAEWCSDTGPHKHFLPSLLLDHYHPCHPWPSHT